MQTVEGESRLGIGRVAVLVIVLFLLVRMFSIANGPKRSEAAPPRITPTPALTTTATPVPQILRPQFLACAGLEDRVGLYTATDAICRPAKTLTFEQFVDVSRATGLVLANESVLRLGLEGRPACAYTVTVEDRIVGWLCTDATGLYRINSQGQDRDGGIRWQWSTENGGIWLTVRL
ncbi:MAG: hypothetical protein RMK99_09335 [Anaerolineales bacterium]|nr:hypothetical protein [Anaerolineales bacterium]